MKPTFGITPLNPDALGGDICDAITSEADAALDAGDAVLGPLVQRLLGAIQCAIDDDQATITKIDRKIKTVIGRHHGPGAKCVDRCYSIIYGFLADELAINESYLLQILARTGAVPIGTPLDSALLILEQTKDGSGVRYAGELVLSVREAIPYFDDLIEVLREIRDRLPALPVNLSGEPMARHEPEAFLPDYYVPDEG